MEKKKTAKKSAKKGGAENAAKEATVESLPADKEITGKNEKKSRKSDSKRSSKVSYSTKLDESLGDTPFPSRGDIEWEEFENYDDHKVQIVLSRTSMLLQDYREFKAARTIQRWFRGWFTRHVLAKKIRSAKIIQRAWRFFYAQRYYYRLLENTLQKRILEFYNEEATKIQSLWRGFWVRENVHDQYRLTRMQVLAAEDLLHCVAFKLHHLLRTHQIPGVYSLRNTTCFSKVEKLLASMSFKQHNYKIRVARQKRDNAIREAKKRHVHASFQTEVPYAGPNFEGYCEPRCCQLYEEADADKKMYKILSMYENATRADPRMKRVRGNSKSRKSSKQKKKRPPNDFCADIVMSMKRWNILSPNNISVDKNVFKNPENVEKFLHEIQSVLSFIKPRCHCYMKGTYEECI